jgi:hypothetical protein
MLSLVLKSVMAMTLLMTTACLNIEDDDAPETAGRLEVNENNFFRKPVGDNTSLAADIAAESSGLTAPAGGGASGACAELADCVCPTFSGSDRAECYTEVATMSDAECLIGLDMYEDICS